jgi:hypothetical protein
MQTVSVLLHVEGTAAEMHATCNEAQQRPIAVHSKVRDLPSMMGSSGRLPAIFGRTTARQPRERPSDLSVVHMARRSNDERINIHDTRDDRARSRASCFSASRIHMAGYSGAGFCEIDDLVVSQGRGLEWRPNRAARHARRA